MNFPRPKRGASILMRLQTNRRARRSAHTPRVSFRTASAVRNLHFPLGRVPPPRQTPTSRVGLGVSGPSLAPVIPNPPGRRGICIFFSSAWAKPPLDPVDSRSNRNTGAFKTSATRNSAAASSCGKSEGIHRKTRRGKVKAMAETPTLPINREGSGTHGNPSERAAPPTCKSLPQWP
jgi:hypothetical protein